MTVVCGLGNNDLCVRFMCLFQASGSRFGTIIQSLSCLGAGFVIGFIYSWKLTLMIIGFVPFILAAGMLQMKIMGGSAKQSQSSLEGAGKVRICFYA